MKRLFCILMLAGLIPSAACLAQGGEKEASVTVMSYNIRLGSGQDGTNAWIYRHPATGMMIDDQKPDIFGIQEGLSYQVEYIKSCFDGRRGAMHYKGIGVGREDGKHKGEHMEIFYNAKKIKLIKWGTYWLSETPETPSKGWDAACYRTATWALMQDKVSGKKFYYVNTHLDHKGWEAREKGLALIVERVASMNPEGYPMILTGDFNVKPDNKCLEGLDKIMYSARKTAEKTDGKPSYNGWGKKQSVIDYIYYSGFSRCSEFRTVDKAYAERKFISDHYPVFAELVF